MEETVFTAARRLLRFLRIDEARGGGMISIETCKAMDILGVQLDRERIRQEAKASATANAPGE